MAGAWVLKVFQVDETGQTGANVYIEARQPGLFAYILNLMGLDPTASLKVTRGSISFRMAKLTGMSQTSTALNQIGSFQGGYRKPIELLVMGVFFFLLGLIIDISTGFETLGIPLIFGLLLGIGLIVAYALLKHLYIGFETSGGAFYGIVFKRGILNNVSVDINQIEYTITFINSLIGSASLGGNTFSESMNVTKVANQAVIKAAPALHATGTPTPIPSPIPAPMAQPMPQTIPQPIPQQQMTQVVPPLGQHPPPMG